MKIHWCCGQTYLDGYVNIDIQGLLASEVTDALLEGNRTTLDKYFKYPFNPNPIERQLNKRPFIVDRIENILQKWPFEDNSVDELLMISCWEHFHRTLEIPHIASEAFRVLKPGGLWKFDFPDIKTVVDDYYYKNPEYAAELIYCNQKDPHSIHKWMYTPMSIINHIGRGWSSVICPYTVVEHSYPMHGVIAIK